MSHVSSTVSHRVFNSQRCVEDDQDEDTLRLRFQMFCRPASGACAAQVMADVHLGNPPAHSPSKPLVLETNEPSWHHASCNLMRRQPVMIRPQVHLQKPCCYIWQVFTADEVFRCGAASFICPRKGGQGSCDQHPRAVFTSLSCSIPVYSIAFLLQWFQYLLLNS